MATRRRNDNDNNPDQRPIRPIPTQPRVVRPHRQAAPPTQPWLTDGPALDIDQMPTNRLPPNAQPAPAHHPPDRPQRKPMIDDGDRNEMHTVYKLTGRVFTRVTGYYEVKADINRCGEIMLYSVAVGGQWRGVPFYLTHEAVKELLLADADAQAYYGFPDDDEGA